MYCRAVHRGAVHSQDRLGKHFQFTPITCCSCQEMFQEPGFDAVAGDECAAFQDVAAVEFERESVMSKNSLLVFLVRLNLKVATLDTIACELRYSVVDFVLFVEHDVLKQASVAGFDLIVDK